ncbi:hypothetical protein HU200_040914 [Digitaria exilis]|uniref:Uncharacterized protein n=1 Tax=Digitaria exilis TaxID=1010633 RepID=A0A835BD74_9POAL|nr:hypothetical protein HU200_040914 [Digitaria exilis]
MVRDGDGREERLPDEEEKGGTATNEKGGGGGGRKKKGPIVGPRIIKGYICKGLRSESYVLSNVSNIKISLCRRSESRELNPIHLARSPRPRMASPPASAAGEGDFLEVRCAGCGETLEVERGLTEFACPDCATAQALPPELMPQPPPPRRRRALPLPPAPSPAAAAARCHLASAPSAGAARLPCGACGAMLAVPPGLARCGCPVCGAELAVDPARLRKYLLATSTAPLVPVSLPPVFRALEGRQDYPNSDLPVGHIREHPNNHQLGHLERSQARRQHTQALLEFTDADSDDADTEMSNGITEMPCHKNRFAVASRAVGAKRRHLETLNHVMDQAHVQQSDNSVLAEHPSTHRVHVEEVQNESVDHAVHRLVGNIELIKEKNAVRHTNHPIVTTIGCKSVIAEKRQVRTINQITQDEPGETMPSKPLSPIEHDPEHSNDNIHVEQDEAEISQLTARLVHKSTKRNLKSPNEGFEHRRSKRLAKQSGATSYIETPENESEENEAVSQSRTVSDSLDIDRTSNGISSSSLPQHNMPYRGSNEAGNLHATTQSASIPDISDPESFARYYSKTCPLEVRRVLERNPNLWPGGKEKRKCGGRGPNLCLKVWTMPEGVRIRVSFNDLGQPIGDEARTLSNFLGQIARDGTLAPLTYTDWRFFPEKNKQAMMCLVNLKFILPPIGQIWLQAFDAKLLKNNILALYILELDQRVWRGYTRKRQKRPSVLEPNLKDTSTLTRTRKDGKCRPVPTKDVSEKVITPDQ